MHWSMFLNRLLLVARYGPSALIGPPVVRAEYWPARENVPVPEQTLLLLLTCNMTPGQLTGSWALLVEPERRYPKIPG